MILFQGSPKRNFVFISYFVYENDKEKFSDDIELHFEDKDGVKEALKTVSKWINVDGPIMNQYIRERLNYK